MTFTMHDLTVRAPIYVPLILIEDAGLQKSGERQTMRKEMDYSRLVIADDVKQQTRDTVSL